MSHTTETQAEYAVKWLATSPEEAYIFSPNRLSIEKEEAERSTIRQYNAHEMKINAFIDWTCDKWEFTWYANVCHFFTVCISDDSWEICCKGDREEGGVFPKGTDLAFKKQYVQKQFNKVISKMNY